MVDANLNSFGGNRLKASSEMTISGHCDANRNGNDGLKLQPKRAAEAAETDVMTSRTFNSLPNHYKVKASYKMALEGSSDKVIAESKKVNGAEMRKRLDIVMEWFADFDDNQRTIMVEGLLVRSFFQSRSMFIKVNFITFSALSQFSGFLAPAGCPAASPYRRQTSPWRGLACLLSSRLWRPLAAVTSGHWSESSGIPWSRGLGVRIQ